MKKTVSSEDIDVDDRTYSFFDLPEFAPLIPTVVMNSQAAVVMKDSPILDKMLSAIKWTFLYIPGVAAIHMIMMGCALLLFYKDWVPEMLFGTVGAGTICAFMIMLGIGKLSDLKYLRVVGTVALTSALAAIIYSISIVAIPGDYFGRFAQITLLISILAGVYAKLKMDREPEEG